eukprot:CAMPEP_0171941698 /NCGR_PEP_ID=MMETSP0993-20121228/38070_1 /TAXON_ID=483369 /ORGANISM="non described non described, Strain CCMP2098" /LENGTH=88 /DNA_ID=CAMNT_0012583985 /DNA_START=86 /DNA_END=352 /DNA_ORIENTATION=-
MPVVLRRREKHRGCVDREAPNKHERNAEVERQIFVYEKVLVNDAPVRGRGVLASDAGRADEVPKPEASGENHVEPIPLRARVEQLFEY